MTKQFDPTGSNIILISYPAGAFGNFLYHVLTEFARETVKIPNSEFKFSERGNSHATVKYTNNYTHNPEIYDPTLLADVDITDKRIVVLGDTGYKLPTYKDNINKVFPNAKILRTRIDPEVRHLIFDTGSSKLGGRSIFHLSEEEIKKFVIKHWKTNESYALREYYTNFYKGFDSNVESSEKRQLLKNNLTIWRDPDPQHNVINLSLKALIENPVETLTNVIHALDMTVLSGLDELCTVWCTAHMKYFLPYLSWRRIETALDGNNIDISDITNIAAQGYVNYCIEQKFNVTIPVYDYRDWFTNTKQIKEMLECLKSNP